MWRSLGRGGGDAGEDCGDNGSHSHSAFDGKAETGSEGERKAAVNVKNADMPLCAFGGKPFLNPSQLLLWDAHAVVDFWMRLIESSSRRWTLRY